MDSKNNIQDIIANYYTDLLSSNSLFRSCVIVGSYAAGNTDRLSDIDLIAFVDDGQAKKGFEELKKREPFQTIYSYQGSRDEKFFYKKMIFENFTSAEVHIAEKSADFKLKKPYQILFDHDDFIKNIIIEGDAPKHEDFPVLSSGGDDMPWALHDLFKWWVRGERDLAKKHLLLIADELKRKDV